MLLPYPTTRIEKESSSRAMFALMTEERVATIMASLADDIKQAGADNRERIKNVLLALVSRITLDPETNRCEVESQIDVTENNNNLA